MPVVGNHEFYDGAELGRFLNQTWEGWGPIAGGDVKSATTDKAATVADLDGRSTATSALGAFLSTGNFHALARHHHPSDHQMSKVDDAPRLPRQAHPSNTSRYFSLDYGLIHFVALDLNVRFTLFSCFDMHTFFFYAWQLLLSP